MLTVFYVLVLLIGGTRLVELNISKRHRAALFQKGARDVPERAFPVMVLLHIGILLASILEATWFSRGAPLGLAIFAAAMVVLANGLRMWAIASLGLHWNVRVVDSTAMGVVTGGPYRWIRHPNYVAVFAELTFVPLVGGAWVTFAIGTVAHVAVLARRIALEERILMRDPAYQKVMGDKPRFLPAWGQ